MTNNLRTLLLNLPAQASVAGHPFAQFIDPSFVPLSLDGPHTAFRDLVFGRFPDRLYAEFVATQLYRMAWINPECRRIMDVVDSRTTIDPHLGHLRWSAPAVTVTTLAGEGVAHAVTNIVSPAAGRNSVDDLILYTSLYSELDAQRYFETGEIPSYAGDAGMDPEVMVYSKWMGGLGQLPTSVNGSLTATTSGWFGVTLTEATGGNFPDFMVYVSCQALPAFDLTAIITSCDWALVRRMASLPQTHRFYREGTILLSMLSSSESLMTRFSAAICAYQLSLS